MITVEEAYLICAEIEAEFKSENMDNVGMFKEEVRAAVADRLNIPSEWVKITAGLEWVEDADEYGNFVKVEIVFPPDRVQIVQEYDL